MSVTIVKVDTKKQLKSYIDFPHELYKNDKNYVPEIFIAQRDLLTPGKHPFYKHSFIQLFLAYVEDRIVGRIAAIYNVNHNAFSKTNEGFFGFFDLINDQTVASALLSTAEAWLKEKGANKILGPVNLSTNETCGLLVDGFNWPPVVMMPYNFAYYADLITNYGFKKQTDLYAYLMTTKNVNTRVVTLINDLESRLERNNIIIRQVNKKKLKEEIPKIRALYNAAWDQNLGFVPATNEEFDYLANDLAQLLNPKYCIIAEQDGKVIGFALGIPDINQILIKIKKGRLFPTGLIRLLFGLKKITGLRVLLLGVQEDFRKAGIEACLYGHIIKNGIEEGIQYAECSWILEKNDMVNRAMTKINGDLYKRYRIYEMAL